MCVCCTVTERERFRERQTVAEGWRECVRVRVCMSESNKENGKGRVYRV